MALLFRASFCAQPAQGTLRFEKSEVKKNVQIKMIDDDVPEPDEHFFVKIVSAEVPGSSSMCAPSRQLLAPVVNIKLSQATVTLYDNNKGGVFSFEQEMLRTKDSHKEMIVRVLRREGNKGRVSVDYATADGKAVASYDYEHVSGTLHFDDRELVKEIRIPIVPTSAYDDKEEHFFVHLTNPSATASLERTTNNQPQKRLTCTVTIVNDSDLKKEVDSIIDMMPSINSDKLTVGTQRWREQFVEAVTWAQHRSLAVLLSCLLSCCPACSDLSF